MYDGVWLANQKHGYGVLFKKVDDRYVYIYDGLWVKNRFVSAPKYNTYFRKYRYLKRLYIFTNS